MCVCVHRGMDRNLGKLREIVRDREARCAGVQGSQKLRHSWVTERQQQCVYMGFPSGSAVKNLTAVQESQETSVLSLGWEDLLEDDMATHSSILAWRIPWTEEPGGLQSMGSQRVRHDRATNTHTPRA